MNEVPYSVNTHVTCVLYLMHSCVAVTGYVHTEGACHKDTEVTQWRLRIQSQVPTLNDGSWHGLGKCTFF